MGNAKITESLPATLTPISGNLPEQVEVTLPWGRLYSYIENFKSLDLIDESITLGRAETCGIVVCNKNFPETLLLNVSKLHFTITKDSYHNLIFLKDTSKNGTYINEDLVGKGNTHILQHDDIISLRGNFKLFRLKLMDVDESNKYLPEALRKKYKLSRFLGKGGCGEVHLIFDKTTIKAYALKKIKKANNSSNGNNLNDPVNISNEKRILRILSHPCVIEMHEIVETDTDVFIILEYMGGGELTSRILSIDSMSENEVKLIFYQIALGVQYLHSKGITHRDLKPDNVLLATNDKETLVKISDFGLSKILDSYSMMETVCGTPTYVAPEIINREYAEYSKKVDIWSLGVILYYMLAKELPFRSPDKASLNQLILKGQYSFKPAKWSAVSAMGINLIRRMLVVDPEQRFSITEVLEHPWISEDIAMQRRLSEIINREYTDEYFIETSESTVDSEPPRKRQKWETSV